MEFLAGYAGLGCVKIKEVWPKVRGRGKESNTLVK